MSTARATTKALFTHDRASLCHSSKLRPGELSHARGAWGGLLVIDLPVIINLSHFRSTSADAATLRVQTMTNLFQNRSHTASSRAREPCTVLPPARSLSIGAIYFG